MEVPLVNSLQPYEMPEDSIPYKIISCIPVIGVIAGLFAEKSINQQIKCATMLHTLTSVVNIETDRVKVIQLIKMKNHYKWTSIIREILLIACIALTTFYGALPLTIGGICMVVVVGLIALHSSRLHHNRNVIKELETTGFRPGMEVR